MEMRFIFACFAFACLLRDIEAVKCYDCKVGNDNCNSPFQEDLPGITMCDGKYCLKSVTVTQGKETTTRTCANLVKIESGCMFERIKEVGATTCVCTIEKCNKSHRTGVPVMLLLIPSFVALTFSLFVSN